MTVVDTQLPTGLLCTVIYLFWTFGSLALISTGSSYMAATIPVVFALLYFLQKVYLRTSRRLRLLDLEMRSPLYLHSSTPLLVCPLSKPLFGRAGSRKC